MGSLLRILQKESFENEIENVNESTTMFKINDVLVNVFNFSKSERKPL